MNNKNIKQTKKNKKLFYNKNKDLVNLFELRGGQDRVVKIEEVEDEFGISNRNARDKISEMSMYYAIISLTQEKGYELLDDINNYTDEEILKNIEKINHQINDFQSRISVLKKRMKPLIAWKKVAEKHLKGE